MSALAPDPRPAPVLAAGRVGVRWAVPAPRPLESHLRVHTDPAEPESPRPGVDDLENGDEDE